MRPANATSPPQTVACWLSAGAILGLIPFIGISVYCVMPGVVYEDMGYSVNLVQLCWLVENIFLLLELLKIFQ